MDSYRQVKIQKTVDNANPILPQPVETIAENLACISGEKFRSPHPRGDHRRRFADIAVVKMQISINTPLLLSIVGIETFQPRDLHMYVRIAWLSQKPDSASSRQEWCPQDSLLKIQDVDCHFYPDAQDSPF